MTLIVIVWLLLAILAVVAATSILGFSFNASLALAQDALVYVLVLAWLALALALMSRRWFLGVVAAALVGYHLFLLIPRLTANRVPTWVRHAPRLTVVVSNVFVDNKTPAILARTLLDAHADVIVIAEWNATFMTAFDDLGGRDSYPHRVFDARDLSDYAVGIVSSLPLLADSSVLDIDPLRFARAIVHVGGRPVTLLGLNPFAVIESEGLARQERQLDALIAHLPSVTLPYIVAGDLNTTAFRPKFRQLMAVGLLDAHESLGRGLSASFELSADGILSSPGPIVRLDHALTSDDVRAVDVRNLASGGSDHLPFQVTLAVRPRIPDRRNALAHPRVRTRVRRGAA